MLERERKRQRRAKKIGVRRLEGSKGEGLAKRKEKNKKTKL